MSFDIKQTPRLLAVSTVMWAASAGIVGAEESTQSALTLEEITVTAQRRETALQETPVAITAVTGVIMDKLGAQSVQDISDYVPGLTIQTPSFAGTAAPAIRGISYFTAQATSNLPVAYYLDGQFMDRPYGLHGRLFDIKRVEVLRGPQGVLFGRNATAGAIRIEHNLPDDEFSARAKLLAASFDTYEAQLSVRGPVSEKVSLGIAAVYADSAGFGRNVYNGSDTFGGDSQGVRGAAVIKATDDLRIVLRASYLEDNTTRGYKNIMSFPTQHDAIYNDPNLGPNDVNNDVPSFTARESRSVSAEITYSFDSFDLVGLTGWNDYAYHANSDTDGSGRLGVQNLYRNQYDAYSTEWRVSSTSWDRLQLDAGIYYLHENPSDSGSRLNFFNQGTGAPLFSIVNNYLDVTTDAYAIFGHLAYDFTDRLTARVGVRYSNEEKDYSLDSDFFPGGGTFAIPTIVNVNDSWSSVTPLFGIDYAFADDVFGYLTASKGFKSGGFDDADGKAFDPETVWNYELGVKADMFDNRWRLNTAVFYMDYQDLQVILQLPDLTAITNNAASAEIYGVEVESTLIPVERFELNASLAWLQAEYEDFQLYEVGHPDFPAGVNLGGETLSRAPEWKGSLIATYHWPTSLGDFAAQAAYSYEDSYYFEAVEQPAREKFRRGSIRNVNARASLSSSDGRWELAVFGRNLTDERYYAAISRLGGGASAIAVVNEPRSWGVEVIFSY